MTKEEFLVEHLVIDTGAIIKDASLHKIGKHFYAPPEVEQEVRDARSRTKWEMLPVEIVVKEPSTVALKRVVEEAKKTGDYPSLSLTDMKVIALTYDLHEQFGRANILKVEEKTKDDEKQEEKTEELVEHMELLTLNKALEKAREADEDEAVTPGRLREAIEELERAKKHLDVLAEKYEKIDVSTPEGEELQRKALSDLEKAGQEWNTLKTAFEDRLDELEEGEEEECEQSTAEETQKEKLPEGFYEEDVKSSDEEGWIKPDNVGDILKKMGAIEVEEGVTVGCISTDFAVQNVLLSMDLGLVSLMGLRIKKLRSYILRCRACFTTSSVMTKQFCPKCGHNTLHKVAVTVNEDGSQSIHVNWRRLESTRGMRHSLPAPKGGKHVVGEQLFEDQRFPHNRMARVRTDPLDDSPFALNDVTSRSAVLGIRNLRPPNPHRNPNVPKSKSKKKGKR